MNARPLPAIAAPSAMDRTAKAARNRLLPEGRLAGPMPWVIAIMMFLTVLASAAGIGLAQGVKSLQAQLTGRLTIQLVEPNAARQASLAQHVTRTLRSSPYVRSMQRVPEAELSAQLRPWLGEDMGAIDLPVPALIDVMLAPEAGEAGIKAVRAAIVRIAPQARIDADASFLAPVERLMRSLMWLAAILVLMMVLATGAVVVMAARGAHDANRETIGILHLLGSTDVQIARLFQRRMALDALFGGALGFVLATGALLLLGERMTDTGSELAGLMSLPPWGWAILPLVPLAGVLLAMAAARTTVRRSLERTL